MNPQLRAAGEWITTLEAAAAFMRAHSNAPPQADTEGVLRRVEGAQTDEQKADAADAFRGWLDAVGLFEAARSDASAIHGRA